MYNGVFTEFRSINEQDIAASSGYTVEKVKELLKRMWQMRIIRYIPSNSSPMIFFDEERLPTKDIYISPDTYLHRKRLINERFENMVIYASNQTECRSVVIQRYFGDLDAQPCGICDICLAKRKRTKNDANTLCITILKLLSQESLEAREICRQIKADPQLVAKAIDILKSENKISATSDGKLTIIE
jgi:ATP-dependent DNA helicase RecQ